MKQVAIIFCVLLISFAAKSQEVKEKDWVIRCIQTLFAGMKSGDSSVCVQCKAYELHF
jgi:hypothetical protein